MFLSSQVSGASINPSPQMGPGDPPAPPIPPAAPAPPAPPDPDAAPPAPDAELPDPLDVELETLDPPSPELEAPEPLDAEELGPASSPAYCDPVVLRPQAARRAIEQKVSAGQGRTR